MKGVTEIWGHRGASAYAPECTLPAFELALEQEVRVVHRSAPENRPEDERVLLGFGSTRPSAYRRCPVQPIRTP